MKARYGYKATECRPTNGFRHLTVRICRIREFDLKAATLAAVERGDDKRLARCAALARAAAGRKVYVIDSDADVTYQGDPEVSHWYAPALALICIGDPAARNAAYRAFEKANNILTPRELVAALGAVRLSSLRDDADECVYAGGSIAHVIEEDPNCAALDDPYPKATQTETAAA